MPNPKVMSWLNGFALLITERIDDPERVGHRVDTSRRKPRLYMTVSDEPVLVVTYSQRKLEFQVKLLREGGTMNVPWSQLPQDEHRRLARLIEEYDKS